MNRIMRSLAMVRNYWLLIMIPVLTILLLPISIDNIKFILLAFSLAIYWLYRLLYMRHWKFYSPDRIIGYSLYFFIALSFISITWATDASMGFRSSFILLLFTIFSLFISDVVKNISSASLYISRILTVLFILYLILHLAAIQFDTALYYDWNAMMSKGKNYTTTLLTCLSPYLIFYTSKSQFLRFLKIISIVLLTNLLFITGARGAMLAFFVILTVKFWNYYFSSPYKYLGLMGAGFILVLAVYVLNTSAAATEYVFIEEYRKELDARILMNKNSIKTVMEHPFGVGAGNWANTIYVHGVGEVLPFAKEDEFIRLRSHNLFFKILTELGWLGLTLFMVFIITLLSRYRNHWTSMQGLKKAAWTSILSFLVVSYFYATAISYEYFFSAIMLIAFLSIGILLSNKESKQNRGSLVETLLFVLSLFCMCWQINAKFNWDKYQSAVGSIAVDDHGLAIEKLHSLYQPILHNSHRYDISISQLLAEQYFLDGDSQKAERYYKQALKTSPSSEQLLFSYSTFLVEEGRNTELAKVCLEKILSIQPTSIKARNLLDNLE